MSRPARIANLLRQDRLELVGSVTGAVPSRGDAVIALLLLPMLALFAQTEALAALAQGVGWQPWLGFALGFVTAGLAWWGCRRRLIRFVRDSTLACEALRRDLRLRYHALWQTGGCSLLALLTADLGWLRRQPPTPRFGAALALGYGLALGLTGLATLLLARIHARPTRPAAPVAGDSYRQIVHALQLRPLPGRWPLATVTVAGVGIGLSCVTLAAASREGYGLALEIALLGTGLSGLGRVDYDLWRFARFSGVLPGAALQAHLLLPLTLCLSVAATALPFRPWLALAALLPVLPLGWIVTLLLLTYVFLPRRQAEFQVQLAILLPLLLALFLPWLAALLAAGWLARIGWRARRRYRDWRP